MNLTRTLLFHFLVIITLILNVIVPITSFLFGWRKTRYFSGKWAGLVIFFTKHILRINIVLDGLENLPKNNNYIIASKHQSTFETYFYCNYFLNGAFIFKKEIYRVPIFGWYMALSGMVAIDRNGGHKDFAKMLKRSDEVINKDKRQLIIFPEGTRQKYGDKVKKGQYKTGVYSIYRKTNSLVVPVALNSGKLYSKNNFIIKKGTVTFKFLKPIKPGLKKAEFMEELEKNIESNCNEL